jgi:hypothetical protein
MIEFLRELFALIGSYGPSMAPWTLLFILVAGLATWGGKYALKNVKTLLQHGEELNERYARQLRQCDDQIAARDKKIKELQDDVDTTINHFRTSQHEMAALENTIHDLELQVRGLTAELSLTLTLLEVERNRTRPHDQRIGDQQ